MAPPPEAHGQVAIYMPIVVAVEPLLYNATLVTAGTLLGVAAGLLGRSGDKSVEFGLGFTGGVMLVASFTSLILPGVEGWGFWQVGAGIAAGVALVHLLNAAVPHEHLIKGYEGPAAMIGKLRKSWLIAMAITIHNIPEGLAVGVATAYSAELGFATALAIAIQDVPEGVAVVMPLLRIGLRTPIVVGVLSAVVEGASVIASGISASALLALLGVAMGLAGGAMIYVTVAELFPEIYAEGKDKKQPTFGFVAGTLTMLFLDTFYS